MEYFSTSNIDEGEILQNGLCNLQHHGLDNAFEACLDSCILSIFDSPNETGNCDIEESEATLLMALTETLDSVDDENLSPFDTLPDSEIFQSQKAHEHFLHLSGWCFCTLQISDSAEDDATFSKHTQDLGTTSLDELDWCLPISLEKDGENMSVTLGDLVKHMHPYSMTLCLEGEDQLLAREGIVLEVVDGGEHGEPILAIPDLSFPFPLLSGDIADGEQGVPGSSLQSAEFKPDDIPAEVASSKDSVVKTDKPEIEGVTKQEKSFQKCQLNRKKKLKAKEAQPVDRRVLRSASSKKVVEEPIKASTEEQKKKKRVTFAPVLTELCKAEGSSAAKKPEAHATEGSPSSTSVTPTPTYITQASRECDLLIQDEITESKNLDVTKPILAAEPLEKEQGWAEVQSNEAKPKTLSLEQYRLLRQQKKLCSLEKTRDHSTKWPTLAEAPRDPRDPRCTAPTPALLIPPASILSSSRKPAPPKSAPQSPSKPTHNSAPSPSIQLNPQKLPVLTCVSNNTINNKVSQTAKRIPAENAVCLPVASATGAPQSMHTARHADKHFPPLYLIGLTPPATPPHQMWKPLAPVALLGKPKKSEVPKLTPGKVITIEPRPLPASKLQNRAPTSSVTLGRTQPFSLDHDYCLLPKESPKNELSSRWSIKQQPSAIIKAVVLPSTNKTPQQSASKLPPTPATAGSLEKNPKPSHPLEPRSQCEQKPLTTRTITLTPDASPDRLDSEGSLQDEGSGIHQRFQRYSERSPSPCCHKRGRSQRTYRKRVCSSSGSRSSSSGSSRSRSRSPSPSRKRLEERRVVYVGRVHGGMTRKELRERFSFFGEIEECTVHFREHGDNYGFVTYYNKKNAFDAIENGGKLRQPNELPFDLCFGGRRQFCRTSYADLDSNRDFDPVTAKGRFDALDFDTLLKQAQRSLKR
uniref:PPARG related coactivator 1 n=1 Tax=Electrophorus electricus TaxID=8005 RepID=A0A4W4GC23_ELEEL